MQSDTNILMGDNIPSDGILMGIVLCKSQRWHCSCTPLTPQLCAILFILPMATPIHLDHTGVETSSIFFTILIFTSFLLSTPSSPFILSAIPPDIIIYTSKI